MNESNIAAVFCRIDSKILQESLDYVSASDLQTNSRYKHQNCNEQEIISTALGMGFKQQNTTSQYYYM